MKIIKPSIELLWYTSNPEKAIELAGRTCYKSEAKITDISSGKFCKSLVERGHLAMVEHAVASFRIICDRGVSHELVRHRLCSFAQESTRYVNYKEGLVVIEPPYLDDLSKCKWESAMLFAENIYKDMIVAGVKPEIARSVLPNSLKTEIVITANFREWLKIIELRTSKFAHPQIREVITLIEKKLQEISPNVFILK
jgi:thymidylate synthase (FAD)